MGTIGGEILAPWFLGLIGASILTGITIVQGYIYYTDYPNDWRFQKISVGVLLVMDVFHLTMTIHANYYYLITNDGIFPLSIPAPWSLKLQLAINVVVIIVVQSLYALRVWKIGRHFSRIWPILIAMIILAAATFGIVVSVQTYNVGWGGVKLWTFQATYASACGVDIILALCMCFYLNKCKTSFTTTNNRIVTIMHYVVITGGVTSACSLACLITLATPEQDVSIGLSFLLTKLYVCSYIAMMNSRKRGRDQDSSSFDVSHIQTKVRNLRGKQVSNTMDTDMFRLSQIGFRSQPLDGEGQSTDLGIHEDTTGKAAVLGISVHRTEESHYDDDTKIQNSD